jgi:hypothetical protein
MAKPAVVRVWRRAALRKKEFKSRVPPNEDTDAHRHLNSALAFHMVSCRLVN